MRKAGTAALRASLSGTSSPPAPSVRTRSSNWRTSGLAASGRAETRSRYPGRTAGPSTWSTLNRGTVPRGVKRAGATCATLLTGTSEAVAIVTGASTTRNRRNSSPTFSLPDVTFARTTYGPFGSTRKSATACARAEPLCEPGDIVAGVLTRACPSGGGRDLEDHAGAAARALVPSRSICNASRSSCLNSPNATRGCPLGSAGKTNEQRT